MLLDRFWRREGDLVVVVVVLRRLELSGDEELRVEVVVADGAGDEEADRRDCRRVTRPAGESGDVAVIIELVLCDRFVGLPTISSPVFFRLRRVAVGGSELVAVAAPP